MREHSTYIYDAFVRSSINAATALKLWLELVIVLLAARKNKLQAETVNGEPQ
jgi:hypothetical protein